MTFETLTELTDPTAVTSQLQATDYRIDRAEPTYIRHKPGETTIVAYRLALPDRTDTWSYAHWCEDPARADEIHSKAATLRPRLSPAGPGLSRLGNRTVFYAFPNDARLRRLRWYTDPRKIKRSFESLSGPTDPISGSRTAVEVLRYKPERRVVARVDLATTNRIQRLLVRYTTRRQASHLSCVATHLRAHGIDTPAPVGQLDDDHVTVDEYIDGSQVRDAIRADTIDPAALTAAIAHFHMASAPPATPRRSAAGDLARALEGLTGLSTWYSSLAQPARATANLLRDHLPEPSNDVVLLHGDLHTKNILVSSDQISFIDLERVAIGPAAIDLGLLNAHAIALGIRRPGWSPDAADHARSVADHYQSSVGDLPETELAWHTALGLVEQALLVIRQLETGWRHTSTQLLESAQHQLQRHRAPTP